MGRQEAQNGGPCLERLTANWLPCVLRWSIFLGKVDPEKCLPRSIGHQEAQNGRPFLERSTFLRNVDPKNVTPGALAARRPKKVDLSLKGRPSLEGSTLLRKVDLP